ncbi:tannase and feruloyl esterase [Gymnopus androsaceus JB14]|uniref:Carboxylic ester hydrolase n=1 Tax=Gymnopus androsaceus JB14 TaxID=1447944 RepID=A0A6A4GXK2_9AGAR|nr:tannase and feruloyl esterase [Gymnopus androsaceus JB14]
MAPLTSLGLLLSAFAFLRASAWDQEACESFTTLPSIPEDINATLTSTTWYAAGALFNETDPNTSLDSTGFLAFCRVQINITTSNSSLSKSEIWLPEAWNGRFFGFGNGASGGGFAWSELGYLGVNSGFAGHATNGGHSSNGSDASWALGHPEVLVDWHWRAMHQGTVAAKAIIASYYNTSEFNSYYGSCSAGGRQGFIEAERFPDDYDSYIIGSPALDDVRQSADALWVNQKFLPVNGSTWLSNDTWGLVHDELMRQCDGIDGVMDGVITDPDVCPFNPNTLLCRPGTTDTSKCLTFDQLGALNYYYTPWIDTNDTWVWPGFPYGNELVSNIQLDGGQYGQDGDFIRYTVVNDSSWTVDQINFTVVQLGEMTSGIQDSANNPNLEPLVSRGAKIAHFVGWNDQYISAHNSIRWHDEVDAYMTANTNYTTDDYYRLFVVPGMTHCSGGLGANVFGQPDSYVPATLPLSNDPQYNIVWANGNAPDEIIGTSYNFNNKSLGIDYQRPICPYPKKAIYDGSSDTNNATSFYCDYY